MVEKAHLSSVEALDSFRNRMILYLEKATNILDEVSSEVRGTLAWLEDQQKPFWEQQVKRRMRALEEAQHEIFGARLSQFRESNDAQQMAVHRAKRALRDAEEKLRRVKFWCRRYQSDLEPLGREVEKLRTVLVQDLKKGAAHLERILRTLDGYAALRAFGTEERSEMLAELTEETGVTSGGKAGEGEDEAL
jgi:ribosomal protein L20